MAAVKAMAETVPIAVGLVGPGAVGRALLEQLRVEVSTTGRSPCRQLHLCTSLTAASTALLATLPSRLRRPKHLSQPAPPCL